MNASRTYAIVNWSDVTDAMVSTATITDKSLLRRSVSGTDRAVVGWEGSTPSGLESHTHYTHSQIKTIVDSETGDWYTAPPDIE